MGTSLAAAQPTAAVDHGLIAAVDDRALVRSGLARVARRALDARTLPLADLEQARTAAFHAGGELRAVLLGVRPGDDPAALLRAARELTAVVVFVLEPGDPQLLHAARSAGADGLVALPDITPGTLLAAIEAAESGAPPAPSAVPGDPEPLTARGHEILAALADGLQDDEIALRLGISTSSVRRHVSAAQQSLRARTRAQAIALAIRRGWL